MNVPTMYRAFTTPVLFMIFNRPETTKKVFDAIRGVRPAKLYVAADGPRLEKAGEAEKCEAARRIATAVDWDCEVHTLFSDRNLGCGRGPSSAITWFFANETEGIILEDDCMPVPSFFSFCAELLERYRHDTRIMQIGGNNYEKSKWRENEYSYTFSNLAYIWGWATWRRAWKIYDFNMDHYQEIDNKKYLDNSYDSIYEQDFFQYVFSKMRNGDTTTSRETIWDYQWQFALKIHSGLVIVPNRNLVVNLGIGEDATHTTNPNGVGHDLKLEEMDFPLIHPEFIMADRHRDRRNFNIMHTSLSFRLKAAVKRAIPKLVLEKMIKPLL